MYEEDSALYVQTDATGTITVARAVNVEDEGQHVAGPFDSIEDAERFVIANA